MTAKDEELQILTNVIGDGWPEILAQACEFDRWWKHVIELYWNCRDEWTTDNGLVYKGHHLVIPAKERSNIAKSLHELQVGIEGTLWRARNILSSPEITAQLKDYLSKSGFATVTSPNNVKSL